MSSASSTVCMWCLEGDQECLDGEERGEWTVEVAWCCSIATSTNLDLFQPLVVRVLTSSCLTRWPAVCLIILIRFPVLRLAITMSLMIIDPIVMDQISGINAELMLPT
ncbi:hypothetical protein BKA82DRAFT_4017101 [Pisolithus tinctorius]|nr:hypothetical protein BKA82DRAFT_4017101 [Pisolithus tinctorius]